ncbi:MAG: hypothetical protein M0P74_02510 [Syntrophales bacterium]|jgi:hypothetical protein|nr:hypothetical protein [Syntrophales bacterium]
MKWYKMAALILGMLITATTTAVAGDFDWLRDLNIQAQADSSGFRARLATRFQIGDAQISAVLGNITDPADAYMVFRLGELSHNSPERVVDVYKANKKKDWGVIAQQLGIKPGSSEFHALKQGHDLDRGSDKGKKDSQGKNKVNDRDKGKGKNK